MIFIQLNNLESVNTLCSICEKYKDDFNVDLVHGRQIIDGRSILGTTSLMGKVIKVVPITSDITLINAFFEQIKMIGGYRIEQE